LNPADDFMLDGFRKMSIPIPATKWLRPSAACDKNAGMQHLPSRPNAKLVIPAESPSRAEPRPAENQHQTNVSAAEIYLLGAHVTGFQKDGEPPLLFMSAKAGLRRASRSAAGCRFVFRGSERAKATRRTASRESRIGNS